MLKSEKMLFFGIWTSKVRVPPTPLDLSGSETFLALENGLKYFLKMSKI